MMIKANWHYTHFKYYLHYCTGVLKYGVILHEQREWYCTSNASAISPRIPKHQCNKGKLVLAGLSILNKSGWGFIAQSSFQYTLKFSLRYNSGPYLTRWVSDLRKAIGFVITMEPPGFVLTKQVGNFLLRVCGIRQISLRKLLVIISWRISFV